MAQAVQERPPKVLQVCAAAVLLLAVVLAAVPARAGRPAAEVAAAAQAAFDDGMRLMKEGRNAEACVRLEQSIALAPGMAAQFRLAECYETIHRLASAWRNYRQVAEAADAAGMVERGKLAWERADGLKSRLARLTIVVPAPVAAVPGLRITRGGQPLARELWNVPDPVDVAPLRVAASAPGRESWSTDVVVRAKGTPVRVEVPPLGQLAGAESAGDAGLSSQSIAGIALTVAGAGALVVGVAIGLEAQPRYDETNEDPDLCGPDGTCSEEGLAIRNSVRLQGNIATAVFVAGAASLVGGVVLWLTAPDGEEPAVAGQGQGQRLAAPQVGLALTPSGVVLRGCW